MNKILKCLLSVFMVISLAFSSLAALVALFPSVACAADSCTLTICPMDADTGYPLEGTGFFIESTTGEYARTVVAGADGTITIRDLPAGRYLIKNTTAAAGYSLIPDVVSLDITLQGITLVDGSSFVYLNGSILNVAPPAVVRCSSCNLPVPSSADLDANGKCLHCTSSNFVYRTYRLFDAVVDEKDYSASNIEYSSPDMATLLQDYCGVDIAQDAAQKIKENIKNDDELVSGSYGMDLARAVAESDIVPVSIHEFGTSSTFDKEGYYLILTMDSKGGIASVASLPIFRLLGEDQITVKSKTALPTLRKEYISNGVSGSSVVAGLGDTVRVRLTGTLPDNFASYEAYQYIITDKTEYLSTTEDHEARSVSIKLNGTVDITNVFIITPDDEHHEFTFGAAALRQSVKDVAGVDMVNTDIITIEYDAVLSSIPDAVPAGNPARGFSNAAELEYSNNPLNTGSAGTLSASASLRSYALDLLKVDNATAEPLANVGFTVKNAEGKYLTRTDIGLFSFADDPYIFSTGENGRISLEGLAPASYTIDEVLPANDYRPLDGSIDFNLEYSSTNGGFTASVAFPDLVSVDDAGSLITVKNSKVLSLPITGAHGAVICAVLGVGCLIVSLVLYLRKRSERKFLE